MVRLQTRIFVVLLAFAVAAVPLDALAQSGPTDMPSYAAPVSGSDEETIHGHIASVDDADTLHVSDDRGFVDNVQLQQGTIINPSGTRLLPGMIVTIAGVNRGSVFAANQIDIAAATTSPVRPARGTALTGILGTSLDSKSAYVGEDVVLNDVSSSDGSIAGATIFGTVTDVTPPGQGQNAQVKIHFDSLRLADGTTTPVDGIVASMQVKTKNNAAKEVGGALVGMLAGNALAKTILGVGGGGIAGAIGGYLIAKDNRSDVVIPANTVITVRLVESRRQAF